MWKFNPSVFQHFDLKKVTEFLWIKNLSFCLMQWCVSTEDSCPRYASVKPKIQRGRKKKIKVTFNLKWVEVQGKQLFWMLKFYRLSSLEHAHAKWHWGIPLTSIFLSLNFSLLFLSCSPPTPIRVDTKKVFRNICKWMDE